MYEYGTADGNPDNVKRVDFIRVQMPHPLLEAGLVIADTPGLGGLFREHSDITWRYVPNADAVFFVLDSVEAVMSKEEVESLHKLRRMTSLLYFVQTKMDAVGTEQWQQWRERNLDIIAEHLQIPRDRSVVRSRNVPTGSNRPRISSAVALGHFWTIFAPRFWAPKRTNSPAPFSRLWPWKPPPYAGAKARNCACSRRKAGKSSRP